jgi:hypothetical protein
MGIRERHSPEWQVWEADQEIGIPVPQSDQPED